MITSRETLCPGLPGVTDCIPGTTVIGGLVDFDFSAVIMVHNHSHLDEELGTSNPLHVTVKTRHNDCYLYGVLSR